MQLTNTDLHSCSSCFLEQRMSQEVAKVSSCEYYFCRAARNGSEQNALLGQYSFNIYLRIP